MSKQSFEDKLAAIRQIYTCELPDRIADIKLLWSSLLSTPADEKLLRELQGAFHKLAGSGASFGFPMLSKVAKSLEHIFQGMISTGEQLTSIITRQIQQLIEELEQAANNPDHDHQHEQAPADHARNRYCKNQEVYFFCRDEKEHEELTKYLTGFGYRTRIFSNTEQAVKQFNKYPPCAAIIDIDDFSDNPELLAGMDSELKKDVCIVYLSNYGSIVPRLEAARNGADAYFVKPVDASQMLNKLNKLTDTHQEQAYRILIIDDSESLSAYYALTLETAGCEICRIHNPFEALETIKSFDPELILMDLYMPECSGEELARVIRQDETIVGTPIVFLSSEGNREIQLSAIGSHGDDFLTKPIQASHLISSVTARAERYRTLRSRIVSDSLTGLYNHTKMKQLLNLEMERSRRSGQVISYIMIDIDHFKSVNDRFGHATGDKVITGLARLLTQRLRKTDIIGRYGGEEFAIILPDTPAGAAFAVINALRTTFNELIFHHEDTSFQVSFSAGIAPWQEDLTASQVSEAADQALYLAKAQGRNRVCLSANVASSTTDSIHTKFNTK